MYGIDISSYQRGIDLSEPALDFCIFKITEGKSLVMNTIENFRDQLISNNKLMGFYHFARPDINDTETLMEKEADFFIEILNKYQLVNKGILCIDWEPPKNSTNTRLLRALILRIQSRTGLRPFLYVTPYLRSKLQLTIDDTSTPIWLAKWGQNNSHQLAEHPTLSLDGYYNYAIWQYTSKGQYPGWDGLVDLDYSPLTPDEWKSYSIPPSSTELSPDMEWAIKIGLIKGFADGTIRPSEAVTRSQLATVCKRLYDLLS